MIDDDLGPVGGVGSGRSYGGRRTSNRNNNPAKPPRSRQVQIALDDIKEATANQQPQLTTEQLARRLRRWLQEEWDTFISLDEACKEVQKRQP